MTEPAPKKTCGCDGKIKAVSRDPCCGNCALEQLNRVEVHLGAAWPPLREVPAVSAELRLLAVGHLYHAACEATPWPNLRKSIQAACLRLQQRGQVPDFPALAGILRTCRLKEKASHEPVKTDTITAESATLPTDTQGGVRS